MARRSSLVARPRPRRRSPAGLELRRPARGRRARSAPVPRGTEAGRSPAEDGRQLGPVVGRPRVGEPVLDLADRPGRSDRSRPGSAGGSFAPVSSARGSARGAARSARSVEDPQEDLDDRADPQGEHDRAQPDRPAERPTGDEDRHLDATSGPAGSTTRNGGGGRSSGRPAGPARDRWPGTAPRRDRSRPRRAASSRPGRAASAGAGRSAIATFVAVPITTTLRTVPIPGSLAQRPPEQEDRDPHQDAHRAQLETR